MKIYLDTNILLAFVDENDLFHDDIVKLFSQPNLKFFTSPITLIEFECKIARLKLAGKLKIDEEFETKLQSESETSQIKALIEYYF